MLQRLLCLLICSLWLLATAQAQPTTSATTVPNAPDGICHLPIGSQVPALELQSLDGKPFALAPALQAKPTILIYFRGGW